MSALAIAAGWALVLFIGWLILFVVIRSAKRLAKRLRDLESRPDVAEADLRNLKGVPPRT